MTEVVVDSSVALKWVADEPGSAEARALRKKRVVVPPLLCLEVLDVAGRSWGWPETALIELARDVEAVGMEIAEPSLRRVVTWTAAGLTAYDASYVALAEERGLTLITADVGILDLAPEIARPLAG